MPTRDGVRDALFSALSSVGGPFPFHVMAVVEGLDGSLTQERWLACSRILRSLLSLPGVALDREIKDERMRAVVLASACESMASAAAFCAAEIEERAARNAMELIDEAKAQ